MAPQQIELVGLDDIRKRLRKRISTEPYDSYKHTENWMGELRWTLDYIAEGQFGPTASLDRSLALESHTESSVERIMRYKEDWKNALKTTHVSDIQDEEIKDLAEKNPDTPVEIKNKGIHMMKDQYKYVKKGTDSELKWTEKSIGLTAAFFELMQEKKGEPIELRKNQLLFMEMLTLGKGKYSFGELFTHNRAVELDTGEGKTYASALAAAVMALRGERVHIVERNYISAQDHARQMGQFFTEFLDVSIGVLTEINEEGQYGTVRVKTPDGGTAQIITPAFGRKSFIFDPELQNIRNMFGVKGRNIAWESQVCYTTSDAGGFDYLNDHQIRPEFRSGQPDLEETTQIVMEADETLDRAKNPWIISTNIEGGEVWDFISEMSNFDRLHLKSVNSPEERRAIAKKLYFRLWYAINEWGNIIYSQGAEEDFEKRGFNFAMSEGAGEKFYDFFSHELVDFFPSLEDAQEFLHSNSWIQEAALNVFLGMKYKESFIGEDKTVLLDEYGLPIEKHQMPATHQMFLQMHHHWKEWREKAVEVFNSRLTYEQRRAIEKMKRTGEYNLEVEARQISQIMAELFSDKFEISEQIDRQLLIPYLKKAGRTLFVSGSLIPISGLFGEIFEAQTVRISRHSPIKDKTEIANTEQLQIKCMDGGIADVDFHKNDVEQTFALLQRLNQLRESNRMGLIIMPTIEKAQELARLLEKNQIDCEIVSGEEEWKQTGALEKVTKKGAPGKIIISTLIAHRDIDLKIPREVEENGGAEVIVVGLPPNERALWQSLQRVLRGDIPGTRRLMLSREDFQTIFNRIVLQDIHFVTSPIWETLGGQRKLHENHIKKMHKLWRGAVFHHSLDAKRELFKECLSYLRYEEFRYKRQLTFLFMRDEKLDEWKQEFIERMEKILPKKLDATPSDILIQLIPYLPPNSPNLEAQMNSLTRMQQYPSLINSWAMFLEDMEHEFNTTFLTDLENRKFPLDVVKKRWQNFIGRRLNQLDKNPD